MAQKTERQKIGLIFSYDEGWIAGSYYILNLIYALDTLPDNEKPKLIVYSSGEKEFDRVKATNYPYFEFKIFRLGYYSYDYTFVERLVNKISLKLSKKLVFDNRPKSKDLSVCFPNPNVYFFEKLTHTQKVQWIPDFQEHYLPEFFTKEEIQSRKEYQEEQIDKNSIIIFSSQDAQKSFYQIYPEAHNKTFVLNFAVTHPNYQSLNLESLLEKYKLPRLYFFAPNQFWAHKNQKVVLKAVKSLKDKGTECVVAFSGKMHDYRNPAYTQTLLDYVEEQCLEDNIKFLGFIDRAEQLKLMSESLAIIQPSLFEGWSTVVEDSKAMNQYLILSHLNVHQEQIQENVTFFDPRDAEDLALQMEKLWQEPIKPPAKEYSKNIQKVGKTFMEITENLKV